MSPLYQSNSGTPSRKPSRLKQNSFEEYPIDQRENSTEQKRLSDVLGGISNDVLNSHDSIKLDDDLKESLALSSFQYPKDVIEQSDVEIDIPQTFIEDPFSKSKITFDEIDNASQEILSPVSGNMTANAARLLDSMRKKKSDDVQIIKNQFMPATNSTEPALQAISNKRDVETNSIVKSRSTQNLAKPFARSTSSFITPIDQECTTLKVVESSISIVAAPDSRSPSSESHSLPLYQPRSAPHSTPIVPSLVDATKGGWLTEAKKWKKSGSMINFKDESEDLVNKWKKSGSMIDLKDESEGLVNNGERESAITGNLKTKEYNNHENKRFSKQVLHEKATHSPLGRKRTMNASQQEKDVLAQFDLPAPIAIKVPIVPEYNSTSANGSLRRKASSRTSAKYSSETERNLLAQFDLAIITTPGLDEQSLVRKWSRKSQAEKDVEISSLIELVKSPVRNVSVRRSQRNTTQAENDMLAHFDGVDIKMTVSDRVEESPVRKTSIRRSQRNTIQAEKDMLAHFDTINETGIEVLQLEEFSATSLRGTQHNTAQAEKDMLAHLSINETTNELSRIESSAMSLQRNTEKDFDHLSTNGPSIDNAEETHSPKVSELRRKFSKNGDRYLLQPDKLPQYKYIPRSGSAAVSRPKSDATSRPSKPKNRVKEAEV